jgi:uncharacterized protein (TIGR03085 family)
VTTPSVARLERTALCDLALELGPDAPTLCGDWTVRDLVTHLIVRERSPWAGPGLVVPALSGVTDWEMRRVGKRDFTGLVDRLRTPILTPVAIPSLDKYINTLEFFVHHEDIRRAQPAWEPRPLTERTTNAIWAALRTAGRGLVSRVGVPVVVRRSDTDAETTLRRGGDPAVVAGDPADVVLFLFGRNQVGDLEFSGPSGAVARLQAANLGV